MNQIVTGKEKGMTKENDFSFPGIQKESVRERIKLLMRGRSKSAVAKLWGLPFSTLNNYFEKDAIPSLQVASQIAAVEGVTIDWLVLGTESQQTQTQPLQQQSQQYDAARDKDVQIILAIWQGLEPNERESISKLLSRRGGDFLAILLDKHIQELHELDGVRRLLALELKNIPEEKVREIYEEYETTGDRFNLTDKQASA
ncbi:helix-turn-helix transcriptional regulator [Salmonella enterica]|uniref:Helix-turn-helix transcriptional regulator n=1 Tax=Salmonella enterica subsp. enterica serovar Stanley TaxID=192953 RepID=A0A752D089_SALET|nr:helix-turn-helix transcriptional regulator [Salmonella enterica subsp. enterica]EHK3168918.1 helix-turn-helix transcriptional regulator [Salmonella enterica subsp. enterica serovar Urbana]EKQ9819720.1 helix-turn-helix transcriptional regulator [Salmonella enterica subsp. enterica serovar Stanley]EKR1802976.1 helix-turn-helix transcriptional regulator [Salmonella enterica subsp. enterica serovar Dublin]ELB8517878.1 helix-turn-helix transcriptional regulator [Salmonella enterica]